MNFKFWQKNLHEKGLYYFLLDIKAKFTEKSIQKKFYKNKMNEEQKELINHFFYYSYLKKKYNKWLQNQDIDLSFNKPNETKIIWWCWFQGEENAPLICKKCLSSIRKFLPDYEIKIITEENMFSIVQIPDFIKEKYYKGLISKTHLSDILRICLLFEYGGAWLDSTIYLTDNISDLLKLPLFYFKNYDRGNPAIIASNWFISSTKNHPFIKLLKDFIFLYWKDNNVVIHYYFFHFLMTLLYERFPSYNNNIPTFSNIPPHILQREQFYEYNNKRFEQIKQISRVHKLNRRIDISNEKIKGTNLDFILNLEI